MTAFNIDHYNTGLSRHFLFLFLFNCLFAPFYAQEVFALPNAQASDLETKALFNKYLTSTDSAEYKIIELLDLAHEDRKRGDLVSPIKKMEVALILEKHIS